MIDIERLIVYILARVSEAVLGHPLYFMNLLKKRTQDAGLDFQGRATKTLKMETGSACHQSSDAVPSHVISFSNPISNRSDWGAIDHSKIHCLSPIGSDSEEESGYVSCASSDQKSRETQEIDKLFADIRELTNGPAKSDSVNDLSSAGEQSDFCDLNKSLPVMDERSVEGEINVTDRKTARLGIESDIEDNETSECIDKDNGKSSSDEKDSKDGQNCKHERNCDEWEHNSHTSETNYVDSRGQTLSYYNQQVINIDNSQEQTIDRHDSHAQTTFDSVNNGEISSEEEENADEESEDGEGNDNEDDIDEINAQILPKCPYLREKSRDTESEGTWVSDDENCDTAIKEDKQSNGSYGPDLQDFFDTLGDGISYECRDDNDIATYPSPVYFREERETQWETAQSSDSEDDYNYIFQSNLTTGKCYAFPRKDPRTITEAVEFWETDFEVKGAIYPRMSIWETKGLAPSLCEDVDDYETFNMYKSLYDKWVKCNKNRDQWLQKYWGKSIETISKMKEPAKRKLPPPNLVCPMETEDTGVTSSEDTANHTKIAEARRRRRYNAMFTSPTRGSSGCY